MAAVIASMGGDSVLGSLRDVQHKDAYGNPIGTSSLWTLNHMRANRPPARATVADLAAADPDLSNPTRNRWERPLDTIRSFEAAIDDGYTRRASMIRSCEYPRPV